MQPFENVREELLKAGIAAGAINRYVIELREHLADLTAKERGNGGDAMARARTLMGSDTQLVQAMLDRKPPRALSVKAPWAVFGLAPVVAIVALSWLIAMAMMRLMWPMRDLMPAQMPGSYQALIAGVTIFTGYLIGPLLAATSIAIALRQRLSSAWVWMGLVLIALFSGFFAFHAPDAERPMYGAALVVMHGGRVDPTGTLILVALRAGILFTLSAIAWRMLKARQTVTT
ncbi:MAG: hypothetical protein JO256_08535 [Alphaproteobacteria bacterium]|nr:hypothetical protein [Alphaproteobacteria bacterium]